LLYEDIKKWRNRDFGFTKTPLATFASFLPSLPDKDLHR
jgi:hypothetical protein